MKIEDEELRDLFRMESEEYLQRMDDGLVRLETDPQDLECVGQMFRDAHSLKGAARMLGAEDVEALAHRFEDLLGAARRGQMALDPLTVSNLYSALDGIRHLVDEVITGNPSGINLLSILESLHQSSTESPSEQNSQLLPPPASHESENSINHESQASKAPDAHQATDMTAFATHTENVSKTNAPLLDSSELMDSSELTKNSNFRIDTLRVDPKKLDHLLIQASQLSIHSKQLSQHVSDIGRLIRLSEQWEQNLLEFQMPVPDMAATQESHTTTNDRPLCHIDPDVQRELRTLRETLIQTAQTNQHYLESLARKLDDGIRQVRLLPLSTIFQLFPRLVRDLERSLSKSIKLTIEGGDTTADKQIIEDMKEPLVHLVRNAVDHGIEAPGERLSAGKSAQGHLILRAYHTATHAVIEVQDDGRGLNDEAIKATALRRHLYSQDQLNILSPRQIHALIFAPGFSTSSRTTEVSGRGIGMDAVRAQVEQRKGLLHVESQPGQGLTIRMSLPLSLLTTRVLLVQVAGQRFGLPLDYVARTLLVDPKDHITIKSHTAIMIEGSPVFLSSLRQLLRLKHDTPLLPPHPSVVALTGQTQPYVILQTGDQQWGYLVDSFVNEEELIIKSLHPLLKKVRHVSGCSILNDGRVCTILNPIDLMASSHQVPLSLNSTTPHISKSPNAWTFGQGVAT